MLVHSNARKNEKTKKRGQNFKTGFDEKKKRTQKNKRWVQLSRPFCWQPHGTGVSWWQNRSHLGSTDFLLPEKKDNEK